MEFFIVFVCPCILFENYMRNNIGLLIGTILTVTFSTQHSQVSFQCIGFLVEFVEDEGHLLLHYYFESKK